MSWEAFGDPPEPGPMVECPECGGLGEVPDDGTNQGECDYCGGTGEVEDMDPYDEGDDW